MKRIKVDTRELDNLAYRLRNAGRLFPRNVQAGVMRDSLRPMLRSARNEAPKGATGLTRRDLRIKTRNNADDGVTGLVGVSKRKGKSGWRTAFITQGTSNRRTKKGYFRGSTRANNFLKRAHDSTIGIVTESFGKFFGRRWERYLTGRFKTK